MLLHAHDWHTALAPVYLRTTLAQRALRRGRPRRALGAQPGLPGTLPARGRCPTIGLPWELYNWQQLEWYGKVNFLKGGLAFADFVTTVSPTQADELRTPGGGFGLHDVFIWLGDRLVGVLNGIDQRRVGPGHRHADHRAVLGRARSRASAAARPRCSAPSGCRSGARRPSSA